MDDIIKNYYSNIKPSKDFSDTIHKIVEEKNKKYNSSFYKFVNNDIIKVIAVFVLAIIVGMNVTKDSYSNLTERYASEIARNYSIALNPEYTTSSFTNLGYNMNQLNFKIISPKKLNNNFKMLGARYCNVDCNIAAHIRLKDREGNIVSLYQFKSSEFKNIKEKQVITIGNIKVTIWVENDVVMGLAENL